VDEVVLPEELTDDADDIWPADELTIELRSDEVLCDEVLLISSWLEDELDWVSAVDDAMELSDDGSADEMLLALSALDENNELDDALGDGALFPDEPPQAASSKLSANRHGDKIFIVKPYLL